MSDQEKCKPCIFYTDMGTEWCTHEDVENCNNYDYFKSDHMIQISGEQARRMIKHFEVGSALDNIIIMWKEAGYIKKSIIEDAEDEYKRYVYGVKGMLDEEDGSYILIEKLWKAILELKGKRERK